MPNTEFLNGWERHGNSDCWDGLPPQFSRATIFKALVSLAVSSFFLSGCAAILSSATDSVIDRIKCHNECPGGPEEKECIEKCRIRVAAERRAYERKQEDEKWTPKPSYEYRPTDDISRRLK